MRKIIFLLFLAGTAIMMVVMSETGASLKTNTTPMGIINLELPFTQEKAAAVLTAWEATTDEKGVSNIKVARVNTWWDFLFILFYSGLLFSIVQLMTSKSKSGWYKAGKLLQTGVWAIALLDIAENIGMFYMLNNGASSSLVVAGTSVCAAVKWGLVLLVLLYIILSFVMLLRRRNQ